MAKVLTELDKLKKEYSKLVDINQRLKYISEGYYIGYNGIVLLKSNVSFIEKIIHLNDPDTINIYKGAMIMPNGFFRFTKNAKKTKLTIVPTQKGINLGQNDDVTNTYFINTVNPNGNIDDAYTQANVIPNMYKRMFQLGDDDYTQYENTDTLTLSEEDVLTIVGSDPLYIEYNGTQLTLTKHLMMDIKKTDMISIERVCYQEIGINQKRVFYRLRNTCDEYECCTIFNTLQS